jgi:hypothetical protein
MNRNELRDHLDFLTITISISLIVAKAIYVVIIVSKLVAWA